MSIEISKVNEGDVLNLADLIKRKRAIIDERQTLAARLESEKKPHFSIGLFYGRGSRNLFGSDLDLKQAADSQSEWIIDRIYDTAIHSLETEIASLSEKVMKNLIESHKPY